MPRVNQIYNTQVVLVGPAPYFTGHFISGNLNNNYFENPTNNVNLLMPIQRVQDISYSFNLDYSDLRELGKRGTVYNPLINNPSVNLGFSYLQNSVLNDLRLGFNANYYNENSSNSYYSNNFGQSLISGFIDRKLEQPASEPYWPLSTREPRNLFVVAGPRGVDINTNDETEFHPEAKSFYVYGFGNSYLTSYNTRGAVNSFPITTVSYICENLEVYSSGSGVNIPGLNTQTKLPVNSNKFVIPSTYDGPDQVTVLLPGDINLSFESIPHRTGILALYGTGYSNGAATTDIFDLGYKFSDLKAQNYNISLSLNRTPLYSLGYALPVDRVITFPVVATLNTSFIVGDNETGSLVYLFNRNNDYNVKISLTNPSFSTRSGIGIQYDFRRAKLSNWSVESTIGPSKIVNIGFTSELDPDDLSRGMFISGQLNITSANNDLLKLNDGTRFLLSTNSTDVISSIVAESVAF
jgi:hypothetical protein